MKALLTWELKTISRLALEAYASESEAGQVILDRERWLDAAERMRHERAMEDEVFRRSLIRNAERFGLVVPSGPGPTRWSPEQHSIASPEYAQRWRNIEHLVRTLPKLHPWRAIHRELITEPLVEARYHQEDWTPTVEECYEILSLLERAEVEFRSWKPIVAIEAPAAPVPTEAPDAPTEAPALTALDHALGVIA